MIQMDDDFGYGEVEQVQKETSKGTNFFKLDFDKDYYLRVASKPRYSIRHWLNNKPLEHKEVDCEYCGKGVAEPMDKVAQWVWIVIDRAEEEDKNKVKVLQGPNTIALRLKELSEIEHPVSKKKTWGNPMTFDIKVRKTKKSNGFAEYSVDPDPDSRGALSEAELKLVADANIDLEKIAKQSKESKTLGDYGGGAQAQDLETAPEDEINPADTVPSNLGEEEAISDEELKDLPF